MLRNHREFILNRFAAKGTMSSGAVEGLNNTVKLVTRNSYGFRTIRVSKLALFHTLGNLPEPKDGHRFGRGAEQFRWHTQRFGIGVVLFVE